MKGMWGNINIIFLYEKKVQVTCVYVKGTLGYKIWERRRREKNWTIINYLFGRWSNVKVWNCQWRKGWND